MSTDSDFNRSLTPSLTPLVVVAGAFVGGVWLESVLPVLPLIWVVIGIVVVVGSYGVVRGWLLTSHNTQQKGDREKVGHTVANRLWGFVVVCLFVLFGAVRTFVGSLLAGNDISRFAPGLLTLGGVVSSEVMVQTAGRDGQSAHGRFVLTVQQVRTNGSNGIVPVTGQIVVRVPLDSGEGYALPHYGDLVVMRGRLERPEGERNPGGFDYAGFLARQGIYATLTAHRRADWQLLSDQDSATTAFRTGASNRDSTRSLNGFFDGSFSGSFSGSLQERRNPLLSLAYRLREGVLRHGKGTHSAEYGSVLNGLLLGDRGDLPGTLSDDFERTGTAHVLATAGLHVGLVLGLLLALLRFCRIARRPALLLATLTLILYALMAGGRPSVVRAVIMACVVLVGMVLEREPYLPNTLALAALLLIGYRPQQLFEPGFQLSFATVITLLILMPLASDTIRKSRLWVRGDWPGVKVAGTLVETAVACLLLSTAAFLGSAPLIALYFNEISLISVLANLLIVPLIALILTLGFGAALLSSIHSLLALPLDRLLDPLLAWVINVVHTCSDLPYANVPCMSPPTAFVFGYYALLWGFAAYCRRSNAAKETKGTTPAPSTESP